jgi:hypothetical protein
VFWDLVTQLFSGVPCLLGSSSRKWGILVHESRQVTQLGPPWPLHPALIYTLENGCFLRHLHTGSFTLHTLIVCEEPQGAGEETEVWAGWQ